MQNPFAKIAARDWKGFFLVALAIIALDQATKLAVLAKIPQGETIEIIPGLFNLVLTYNLGAAFGMLADLKEGTRQIALLCTTLAAFLVLSYFLLYEYHSSRVGRLALAMIFGGAIGNIIDRARLGKVVDFLDFYLGSSHWPAFNVADSSICVAVFILLFTRTKQAN